MTAEPQNPYFRPARGWGIGFALCFLFAIGGSITELVPTVICIIVGTLGGTICLIFWLALWFTARSLEADLEAFRQGVYLVRWELSAADYRRWWEDRRRQATVAGIVVGVMLLLAGGVMALIFWIDEHKPEIALPLFAGSLALAGLVSLVIRRVVSGPPPTGEGSYTLWIGPDLAILNGQINRWQGPGTRLTSAQALDHPPRLRVDYAVAVKGGWAPQVVEYPGPDLASAMAVAAQIEATRRT